MGNVLPKDLMMPDPISSALITKFIIEELNKGAVRPYIKRAYAAIGIGEANDLAEDIQQIKETLEQIKDSIGRVEGKIDENRLTDLISGHSMLREARLVSDEHKKIMLHEAMSSFQRVTALPSGGETGRFKNSELKSIAYISLATTHDLLENPEELVSKNLADGYVENPRVAMQFIDFSFIKDLYKKDVMAKAKITFNYVSYDVKIIKDLLWWVSDDRFFGSGDTSPDSDLGGIYVGEKGSRYFLKVLRDDFKRGEDKAHRILEQGVLEENKTIVDPGDYVVTESSFGYSQSTSRFSLLTSCPAVETRELNLRVESGEECIIELSRVFYKNIGGLSDYHVANIKHASTNDFVATDNDVELYKRDYKLP